MFGEISNIGKNWVSLGEMIYIIFRHFIYIYMEKQLKYYLCIYIYKWEK
jgi:hypothetical protein